jgi:hypothetical protein
MKWLYWHAGISKKVSNAAVFKELKPSFGAWRRNCIYEATMDAHRVKDNHFACFSSWIDSLL